MTKALNDLFNLDGIYGLKASQAQHEVQAMADRFQSAVDTLHSRVARATGQTAEAAARLYLRETQPQVTLDELTALSQRVRVLGAKQQQLLEGTLMRAENALEYSVTGAEDGFEAAQVLVQALRDFAARLVERRLVANMTENPRPPAHYTAVVRRTDACSDSMGSSFATAA